MSANYENEEFFKKIYNHSPSGIILCELIADKNGNFVDFIHLTMNSAAENHTGWKKDKIIGKRASEIIPPQNAEILTERYSQAVTEERVVRFQEYFEVYDRSLEVNAFHMKDNQFIIVFHDISSYKNTEKELLSKITGLKQMNDLMIDRELSMMSLKKEINELLEELGRPKKYTIGKN